MAVMTSASRQTIHLFLPGLWVLLRTLRQFDKEIDARMPALGQMLRRNDKCLASDMESEARLLEVIGIEMTSGAPVAAFERLADTGSNDGGWWLRADPVSLAPDMQSLVLQRSSSLGLNEKEASALVERINGHFAEDGWHMEITSPERWYLRLSQPLDMEMTPTWRVTGKNIQSYLPGGPDGLKWHAWLNELQMLLHDAPVNERREAAGRPVINGIWVWGGGRLPEVDASFFPVELWGNTPFMHGLSLYLDMELNPLPGIGLGGTMLAAQGSDAIVMLDVARDALASTELKQGIAALDMLERKVFAPLLTRLQRVRSLQLNIYDLPGQEVRISGRGMRRWWRRRQPLGNI